MTEPFDRDADDTMRAHAETVLGSASATDEELQALLVGLALNHSDWRWVQELCMNFSRHASWAVRAVSATCLGHLARIHHELDRERVLARLSELGADPKTTGFAESALEDIERYLPKQ